MRAGVFEGFELGRRPAVVGGCSEDDGLGGGQIAPACLRLFDAEQQGFRAFDLLDAARHGLRLAARVAVPAVVNDRNANRLHGFVVPH